MGQLPIQVFNRNNIKHERFKNGLATRLEIFQGGRDENLDGKIKLVKNVEWGNGVKTPIIEMTSANYVGSEGHGRLMCEMEEIQYAIKNAAQAPTQAQIDALLGKSFIDFTRRSQEAGDLTSLFATEFTDLNSGQDVNLREIYPYRGQFERVSGTNDSVPQIQQFLGETDTFPLYADALGWKTTLFNILYNKLHTMEKVNKAAVDADTDNRNKAIIGTIVGATYVSSQKQAADSTSNSTFGYKMYETWRKSIVKIRGLKDVRTSRKIAVPGLSILCNSANTWDITRNIGGQLTTGGTTGEITSNNLTALPIDNIIEYDRGINDGFTWGKKTISMPGVVAGKAYLFIPKEYLFVMNKRPLTLETSVGSALQLSKEERAWYRVFGTYFKDFLGSSYPATALGAGYGAIIEVTLPS